MEPKYTVHQLVLFDNNYTLIIILNKSIHHLVNIGVMRHASCLYSLYLTILDKLRMESREILEEYVNILKSDAGYTGKAIASFSKELDFKFSELPTT